MKQKVLFCLVVGFVTACQMAPPPQETPKRHQQLHSQARKSPLATRLRILKEEIESMPATALQNISEEIQLLEALLQTTREVKNQLSPSDLIAVIDSLKKRIEVIEQKLGIKSPVEQSETADGSGTPSIDLITAPEPQTVDLTVPDAQPAVSPESSGVSPIFPLIGDGTTPSAVSEPGTGTAAKSDEPVTPLPVPDSSTEAADSDKPTVSLPEVSDSDTGAPAANSGVEAAPSSTDTVTDDNSVSFPTVQLGPTEKQPDEEKPPTATP